MQRYQIYLNPHSIKIIDEVQDITGISRAQLIRDAIDSLAENVSSVLTRYHKPKQEDFLNSLIGSIQLTDKRTTHYARDKSSDYIID